MITSYKLDIHIAIQNVRALIFSARPLVYGIKHENFFEKLINSSCSRVMGKNIVKKK